MAELDADFRGAVPVYEIDQPRERGLVLRPVHARAPGRDATLAGYADHLGHDQRGATQRFAAQVHEVEIADQSVIGGVHVHRRDDDAVCDRARSRIGANIGGTGWAPLLNQRSTSATNSGSRTLRFEYVTRRLRVSRLNANWSGSWRVYCEMFSTHSRLACAARCALSTTGRRSASYAASAISTPGFSCRQAASASASSIASFVPEPIEKWAEWAASPIKSKLPCRQHRVRTVVNRIQRLLLASSGSRSNASANTSVQNAIPFSSLSPGFHVRSVASI